MKFRDGQRAEGESNWSPIRTRMGYRRSAITVLSHATRTAP